MMGLKKGLGVVTITRNADRLLDKAFLSVEKIADEIVVVDSNSTDRTLEIAKRHKARIYSLKTKNLGYQKEFGVKKINYEWVLILDSDEIVTPQLAKEIKKTINSKTKYYGYKIPYQNHLFGKPIYYGGEDYAKLILFKKKYATIKPALVHENFQVKNLNSSQLKNKILHYSYLTLPQMYRKFSQYAIAEAIQKKDSSEKSSLKKIFAYPAHMFWARYIKDKGYKDYWARIFLDLGFAYMEWLTYLYLAWLNLKK
jgi:glycosyltransferase involved in cell wall biosynthesis